MNEPFLKIELRDTIAIVTLNRSQKRNALDEQAIASKAYFFQRPLYQFILKKSFKKVQPFIAFEQSDRGLSIIKASGYYSVP